ncbi:MAG: hypothetical protein Q8934_23675 [Bacillota bacterium]|nr:hypothetical protein [Bacillota bacterium]
MNRNDFSNSSHSFNQERHPYDTPFSFPPQNIKVLVEIANSTFDFNLNKKIKMSSNVQKIQDIAWRTSPIYYQINVNANKLWVSSELVAQITYTKGKYSKVYIQTIQFPWKKTCNIQFIYPPMLPLSNEKKHYEFAQQHSNDESIEHYEQVIYNNENPILDIISTKVVTSKEIKTINHFPFLFLNINCEIFYRLFQYQVLKNNESS